MNKVDIHVMRPPVTSDTTSSKTVPGLTSFPENTLRDIGVRSTFFIITCPGRKPPPPAEWR